MILCHVAKDPKMNRKCFSVCQSQSGKNVTFQSRKAAKLRAVMCLLFSERSEIPFLMCLCGIAEKKKCIYLSVDVIRFLYNHLGKEE